MLDRRLMLATLTALVLAGAPGLAHGQAKGALFGGIGGADDYHHGSMSRQSA